MVSADPAAIVYGCELLPLKLLSGAYATSEFASLLVTHVITADLVPTTTSAFTPEISGVEIIASAACVAA